MDQSFERKSPEPSSIISYAPWTNSPLASFSPSQYKNIPECIVNTIEHLVKNAMNTHFKINDVKKLIDNNDQKCQAKFTKLHKEQGKLKEILTRKISMFEVQQNKSLIGFKGDMSSKFEQMRIGVTDLRSRVDYKLKEMNDVMNKISDLFKLPKMFAEEISKNTAEINLLTDSKLHKLENHMDIKVKDFIEENTLNHIEPKLRKSKILIEECNLEFKDFQVFSQ